jgi:hypothetical protein
MSPEQAAGRLADIGQWSDVYSLGATLYHLLCGKPPFKDDEQPKVILRVQRGDFPRPRRLVPEISPGLEAVCLKAMALKPANRYLTARALADDVEHWLADERVGAAPDTLGNQVSRFARKHRGYVRAGALAIVLIVFGSLAAALQIARMTARMVDEQNLIICRTLVGQIVIARHWRQLGKANDIVVDRMSHDVAQAVGLGEVQWELMSRGVADPEKSPRMKSVTRHSINSSEGDKNTFGFLKGATGSAGSITTPKSAPRRAALDVILTPRQMSSKGT